MPSFRSTASGVPTARSASTRPAHRPSAREAMLDAVEAHLGADGTLSLDSAARAAGVTKPGLMYHFATKEQLLTAILDRLADRYEREMAGAVSALTGTVSAEKTGAGAGAGAAPASSVPADRVFAEATASQRFLAYLDWACQAPLGPADLVIFADPKLRVALTERWRDQLDRWLDVPAGTPSGRRRRLLAVRLMADGLWFDRASGLLETTAAEADALNAIAQDLLGGDA